MSAQRCMREEKDDKWRMAWYLFCRCPVLAKWPPKYQGTRLQWGASTGWVTQYTFRRTLTRTSCTFGSYINQSELPCMLKRFEQRRSLRILHGLHGRVQWVGMCLVSWRQRTCRPETTFQSTRPLPTQAPSSFLGILQVQSYNSRKCVSTKVNAQERESASVDILFHAFGHEDH